MAITRPDRSTGSWRVLLVMTVIYGILGLVDQEAAIDSLRHTVELLYAIVPILGVVFVLLALFNVFTDPQRITHWIGERSGKKGWLIALTAGILSVGPVYAWYPLLSDLRQHGMKTGLIVVFLYSRAIKLPLIPLMVHYYGSAYTLTLLFYMIGFSFLSGLIVENLIEKQSVDSSGLLS